MSDRRCPECFEILECPACDPSITHMVHDAGLREAAQPFLEAALNVFPEEWISPGSSYAIAITVRGSEVDALRAALRSTPAAPQPDEWPEPVGPYPLGPVGAGQYLRDRNALHEATLTQPQPDHGCICVDCGRFKVLPTGPQPDAESTVRNGWGVRGTGAYSARDTQPQPDALRSTPAAPQPDAGSRTECSLVGVHAHSFQGPHVFHEWEPGTTPALATDPRDTVLIAADGGATSRDRADLRALGESPNPTTGDAP